jgi:hypothetical protein
MDMDMDMDLAAPMMGAVAPARRNRTLSISMKAPAHWGSAPGVSIQRLVKHAQWYELDMDKEGEVWRCGGGVRVCLLMCVLPKCALQLL